MQRDDVIIQDIINAAHLVVDFVKGFDKETFIYDLKTRSAVLYQLTVIGEAVKRCPKSFARSIHKSPGH